MFRLRGNIRRARHKRAQGKFLARYSGRRSATGYIFPSITRTR